MRVKDRDMEKIQSEVAELFKDIMTKELIEGGYEMADEPGEDVLLVKPAIVDLDVFAPDIQTASRVNSYSESAGEMTLNLELFDSVTNDKIAKATDRQRDWRQGYMQWRTKVSNRADARRMITVWAKALTSALNEARSATPSD
jgi:Tfp pilus assembly ATPase PilU